HILPRGRFGKPRAGLAMPGGASARRGERVAQVKRVVALQQPPELHRHQLGQLISGGERRAVPAAGQLRGQGQEQLVDQTLLQQRPEQGRAALTQQRAHVVVATQVAQCTGQGRKLWLQANHLDLGCALDWPDRLSGEDHDPRLRLSKQRDRGGNVPAAGDHAGERPGRQPGRHSPPTTGRVGDDPPVALGAQRLGSGQHRVDLLSEAMKDLAIAVVAQLARSPREGGVPVRAGGEVGGRVGSIGGRAGPRPQGAQQVTRLHRGQVGKQLAKAHRRGSLHPPGGELVATVGGILLGISLFLSWYSLGNRNAVLDGCRGPNSGCTGWGSLTVIKFLLLFAAVAPAILAYIIVRGHALSWPRGELTAVTALVALTVTLFVGLLDKPGTPPAEIAISTGWWVALVGDLLILTGSIWRSKESGVRRKPPGVI